MTVLGWASWVAVLQGADSGLLCVLIQDPRQKEQQLATLGSGSSSHCDDRSVRRSAMLHNLYCIKSAYMHWMRRVIWPCPVSPRDKEA